VKLDKLTAKQKAAIEDILDYIFETEEESYKSFCEENEHDPKDIGTSNHVYAKALVAIGGRYED
jgi:hypothetical protein